MAESLILPETTDRKVIYENITPQIEALVSGETDLTANLANIAAVLKEAFDFLWVGFYFKKGDQLVLGPFQGPIACSRINFDQGVCGHAYTTQKTTIVADVNAFEGHIACSGRALSEIVVPIFQGSNNVIGVLDVDSEKLDDFSNVDSDGLGTIVAIIGRFVGSASKAAI